MLKASLVIICTIMVVGNAESSCRRPGDSVDCSGLGTCVNGMCECISRSVNVFFTFLERKLKPLHIFHLFYFLTRLESTEKITGKFCQCNNFGCDRHEGKVCGGKDRGVCDCGQCRCETGFLGSNCGKVDCSIGKKNCLRNSLSDIVCSGNGVCSCNKCDCSVGYAGKYCQYCPTCPRQTSSSCKPPKTDALTPDCNGLGTCVNGSCQCDIRQDPMERITGRYCKCINFNCPRYEGKICGGKTRGVCECGRCKCKVGFLDSNCGQVDCSVGKKNCLHASSSNTSCSGNGDCNCDKCVCNTGYRGKFCEECVSCPGKCNMLSNCVRCQAFNEPDKDTCGNLKCSLNIVLVNVTEEHCHHESSDNCYIIFSPQRDPITGAETIFVQKDKRCVKIIKKDAQKNNQVVHHVSSCIILLVFMASMMVWM